MCFNSINNLSILAVGEIDLPGKTLDGVTTKVGFVMSDMLIIIGAVVAVTIFVVVWALFWRKPKKRSRVLKPNPDNDVRSESEKEPIDESETEDSEADTSSHHHSHRHHRHHRRKHHHTYTRRFPTLAETGGLPPIRNKQNQSTEQS